jgi:hypothetical protein
MLNSDTCRHSSDKHHDELPQGQNLHTCRWR